MWGEGGEKETDRVILPVLNYSRMRVSQKQLMDVQNLQKTPVSWYHL